MQSFTEVYWKRSQTSNMKLFVKIINDFYPLAIFAKSFILDVGRGSECASDFWFLMKSQQSIQNFILITFCCDVFCISNIN